MSYKIAVRACLSAALAVAANIGPAFADPIAGAAIGGGAGALVGHAVSGRDGALVGGALGAVAGYQVGKRYRENRVREAQRHRPVRYYQSRAKGHRHHHAHRAHTNGHRVRHSTRRVIEPARAHVRY